MSYTYVQRDLAEGILNSTDFLYERPFQWSDEFEVNEQERKNEIKKKTICSEDAFQFQSLSYRKAVRKQHFFEVNANEENKDAIMDVIWRNVIAGR